jgi:hypothetical protein
MKTLSQIQTKLSLFGAAILLSAACTSETVPEASSEVEESPPALQSEWVATTPSGVEVTLRPASVPVSMGVVKVEIEFRGEAPDPSLLSLDLVTPDMPMMGVQRFAIEAHDGEFSATIDIPMTGRWNAYVNIGAGTEAAMFEFDVQEAQGEAPMGEHTMPMASSGQEPR